MATIVEISGDYTPLSLYIDLDERTKGDLEVISRAAIAWSKMIKEAAFIIDPALEIRVELVSGTEGSINLNSLIRAVRDLAGDRRRLTALALGIASYFAGQAGGWVTGKGYDGIWDWVRTQVGQQAVAKMSPEEKRQVEEIVTRIVSAKSVQQKAAQVYSELPKDKNIAGVGVAFGEGKKPAYVVPRSHFEERSAIHSVVEEVVSRRTEVDTKTLSLIAPVLSEGDYKWRFWYEGRPMWALMDDPDFKLKLAPGSNSAPRMTAGIQMVVDLETIEELQNGAWTIVNRRIVRVRGLKEPPRQTDWLNSSPEGE